VREVPVYVSPVALLFAVFVAITAVPGYRDRLPQLSHGQLQSLAFTLALLFLLSLVFHELGHCFAALYFGLRVDAITIYGFAGFTEIRPEPPTPWREFVVAASGPAVNLVLGVAALLVRIPFSSDGVTSTLLFDIGWVNVALGILNMLPGLPLDGGRVATSVVWGVTHNRTRAFQVGAIGGLVVGAVFIVIGLARLGSGGGIFWCLLGLYLGYAAWQTLRQSRVTERLPLIAIPRVMRRAELIQQADLPLSEALRRAQLTGALGVVIVDANNAPVAVMSGSATDAVPPARRPWVPLSSVCRRIDESLIVTDTMSTEGLLERLSQTSASELVVVCGQQDPQVCVPGAVVGVLATVDVLARLDPTAARKAAERNQGTPTL
jgi:Zn-dependent protease